MIHTDAHPCQFTESRTVASDHIVKVSRHHDGLTLLSMSQACDMILAFRNVLFRPHNLDPRLSGTLLGNVDGDREIFLHLLADVASRSDEVTVLICGNIDHVRHLTVSLFSEEFDCSYDLVGDGFGTFDSEGVGFLALSWELDCLSAKISAACFVDEAANVCTYITISSSVHGRMRIYACLLHLSGHGDAFDLHPKFG